MAFYSKGDLMSSSVLTTQVHYNLGALKMNLEGITHDESLTQPQPAGNCLNWVVGHILANRASMLKLVGQEPVWTEEEAEPYKRGSAPITDANGTTNLDQIVALLEISQERLLAGLEEISPDGLQAPAPGSKEGQAVETSLALLVFHEAYHVGETGILRRLAGHEGAIQ
jgi:uncharacterized damage-inducible protein DinB